jgi:CHAT domain-containing protein
VGTSDYVVSSYVPTLASLTRSRHGWDPIPHTEIAGLLVCEASCDIDSAGYLTHAVDEVVSVRDCLLSAKARVLNAPSAHISRSQLCSLLDGTPAHILHLACHGIQESDPLKSGLLLQDGKLSIENILRLRLPQAMLAYLSACQTAKGDNNAPDQAIHLAASMLFSGFRSVIGTMW